MSSTTKDHIRFGAWAAFWGDTPRAARRMLATPDLDYLVADHLAEITMALLARARAKDPATGYVTDAVQTLAAILPQLHERGIKVVANCGALNPDACADALIEAVEDAGLPLTVAAVRGDDLLAIRDRVLATAPTDMFTGEPIPADVSSMNAYLGARPIAHALDAGADIVITGRCVDAAVVLGPLLHEFGWSDEDHDLLAGGALAGHIIECGPQSVGGIFTDWFAVPRWDDMGFPVADVHRDGTAVISKSPSAGGLVSPGTVGEQILYEIGDPGAYVLPDVVCDWREVRLRALGEDRVHVSGARGSAPTRSYKVTATRQDGYRAMTTAMFAGIDAAARARRAGEALVRRTDRLLAQDGMAALTESSVEVIGAGDTFGPRGRDDAATEAVLKVGVRHPDRAALDVFAAEFAPLSLVAQGMTGVFAGRPRPAPVFGVLHLLVDKAEVEVTVRIGDVVTPVTIAPGVTEAPPSTAALAPSGGDGGTPASGTTVALRRIAYARSGDKGDRANIGVIARAPEYAPIIAAQVTPERVGAFFAHYHPTRVTGWALPGLHAFNFVIDGVLGGSGGTSTLRYDPQGKSYAAMLLTLPVVVPDGADDGLWQPGGSP